MDEAEYHPILQRVDILLGYILIVTLCLFNRANWKITIFFHR